MKLLTYAIIGLSILALNIEIQKHWRFVFFDNLVQFKVAPIQSVTNPGFSDSQTLFLAETTQTEWDNLMESFVSNKLERKPVSFKEFQDALAKAGPETHTYVLKHIPEQNGSVFFDHCFCNGTTLFEARVRLTNPAN